MRTVIQRVNFAELRIDNKLISSIQNGLVILIGIEDNDTFDDIKWLTNKVCNMRIFSDKDCKMNTSLIQENYEVLLVSQFTLYAKTKKGNRPSFIGSAKPEFANKMYLDIVNYFKEIIPNTKVKQGVFGANMQILLENDGPVTITMDSKIRE